MATPLKQHKAVSALPATLEPDSIYYVRTGDGYDQYVTNSAGVAFTANHPKRKYRQSISGRFYVYTDYRWVTPFDDNYGHAYYQWAESGGTGANPIIEWEHQGLIIPPGTRVTNFKMFGRATSTQFTDWQIRLYKVVPSTTGRWEGVGVDNDAEIVSTELHNDLFYAPAVGTAMTGAINDRHMREVDLSSNTDAEFPDLGELRLYIKPVGTAVTATRYIQSTILIETQDI